MTSRKRPDRCRAVRSASPPPIHTPRDHRGPPQPPCGGLAARYRLGQGALYEVLETAPPRKVISVFNGKPPLGHFFGTVM